MPTLFLLFTFLAGGLLPLAFAPFGFYPLAIVCPALLLWSWLNASTKQAFWRGYLFGVGFFGVGVSWVYVSIHEFGNAGVALAGLITGLMILFLALFPAAQGYLLMRFFKNNNFAKICLAFPALWVLLEWVRSWIFTGFPWLLLGASQTSSWLRGFAPIIGEYGVSFLVVLGSGLLVLFFRNYSRVPSFRSWIDRNPGCKDANKLNVHVTGSWPFPGQDDVRAVTKIFVSLFLFILIWFSGFLLTKIHWTQPVGKPIKVALVQGDIPQQDKWTNDFLIFTLKRYYQFTQQHWDSSLIIWPETAIPLWQTQAQDFLTLLNAQAKQHQVAVITGIPVQDGFNYYNAMMILGKGQGIYYKRHLVPFGEYVPLLKWFGSLLGFLNIPMSDFSAGPTQHPEMQADGFIIAPFICYEVVYEQTVLQELPKANLLVTISNDAWFGHSFASAQHLQIGQFRALETGRYHVFSTNSGITAIIDPQGNVQTQAASFKSLVLTGTIQAMTGSTPIVRMGILPIVIGMMFLLVLGFCFRRNDRRSTE